MFTLNIRSSNPIVFEVLNETIEYDHNDIKYEYSKLVKVATSVIGISDTEFVLLNEDSLVLAKESLVITVVRKSVTIDVAFTSILALLIFIATTFMGCGLDLKIVKSNLIRPLGPAVGFICQFLFMPLVRFLLFLIIS
jgi:sodium/bile acid cotransporter 3/5